MLCEFDYLKPRSWQEACHALAADPIGVRAYAGGTDILVRCREGHLKPRLLVDIKSLHGASEIREDDEGRIIIGAAAPLAQVQRFLTGRTAFKALEQAAHSVGSLQIRNRASVAGNICNASPAADTAPALLVLDALLHLVGPTMERHIPVRDFFLGPGKTALLPGELVRSIILPRPESATTSIYLKAARTKAVDLAQVGVAVAYNRVKGVQVAVGAVAPRPLLALTFEQSQAYIAGTDDDLDRLTQLVEAAISPISDLRSSADYRRHLVSVLSRRAVKYLLGHEIGDAEGLAWSGR